MGDAYDYVRNQPGTNQAVEGNMAIEHFLTDRDLENVIWLIKNQLDKSNTAVFKNEMDKLLAKMLAEDLRRRERELQSN